VFYNYVIFDKINIFKSKPRAVVLGADTDSNFINLGIYYEFMRENLGFDKDDKEASFKIINLMTAILTDVIKEIYWTYTGNCNVPEDQRHIISMKSEFLWSRVLFTTNKKNYASIQLHQEGKLIDPPEMEVKGLTIKKSNVNRKTGEYLEGILKNDILLAEKIDIPVILGKLEGFERSIKKSFERGEPTFCYPMKSNEPSSYKSPYTQGGVRSVIAWNAVYPDDPIILPTQFNVVKLRISRLEDMAGLYETNKDIYQALKKEVFDNENLSHYGLKVMAIPKSRSRIPEWMIPYIDYETIVKDNLANFIPILNSIGIRPLKIRDDLFFSNIVNF
jgi:hypothetical protein